MSAPEAFKFDLSRALIADSGTKVALDGGDTWITCSIATKVSKSGVRFVRFTVQNYARRGIICMPAAGNGLDLHSVGYRAVPLERSEHREFEVRFPNNVNTVGLFVQSATEQCVFVLPVSRPLITLEVGLGLLVLGVACGAAGALIATQTNWNDTLRFPNFRRHQRATQSARAAETQRVEPEPDPPKHEPPERPIPDEQPQPPGFSGDANVAPVFQAREMARAAEAPRPMVAYTQAVIEEPSRTLAFSGAEGSVVGAIEMLNRSLWFANYVVKVINETADPLICSWQGIRGHSATALEPSTFRIEPNAASAVTLSVPLRLFSPFERAFINLRSRNLSCTLETNVPESRLYPVIKALLAFIVLLLFSAAIVSYARPRIVAYALPASASAGSTVHAAYAVTGLGTASYEVSTRSGRTFSGPLPATEGHFAFATGNKPAIYRVALTVRGALGTQTDTRTLRTLPNSGGSDNAQALIGTFEVQNATVRSGTPIVVRYAGRADEGTVRLLDAAQIPVAEVPYSPQGVSSIIAPKVSSPTPYRLELRAGNGNAEQNVSSGILVEPASASLPLENASAGRLVSARELLRFEPPYVRSNSTLRVVILQQRPGLVLALQNASGLPVSWNQITRDKQSVTYAVPLVFFDERFVIVATFKQGASDQIVLAPFVVHAR